MAANFIFSYLNQKLVSMKNNVLLFLSIYTAILLPAQEKIFNGKDLSGWTVHGTEKWWVENKDLVCESGPDKQYGYLSTQKAYKNFELTLQFKQQANGNSGVFIRSSIEGVRISGWQVEVAPAGKHTGGIYESNGRGWLIQPRAKEEKHLKAGDWNDLKIRVVNDEITTWLNGRQMVYLKDDKLGKGDGFIALQIHDGGGIKVRWRKIMVKELP